MRSYPDCYQCILRQAVTVINESEISWEGQVSSLRKVLAALAAADPTLSPSAIAGQTNQVLRETLGVEDFYWAEKQANHLHALSYLSDLRQLIRGGKDPLEQGLKISASGNVIDIIHLEDYDLWQEVETTVQQELLGESVEAFRERLSGAGHLLYLADNVGETVFDRVFLETLDIPVIYAVKSGPILNDATRSDALAAGIDQVAEIVETGSQAPGTVLEQCSAEFKQLFTASDLVISKGQANYETMDEQGDKVFFLLRVKCPVISRHLGAPRGSLVFKQASPRAQ